MELKDGLCGACAICKRSKLADWSLRWTLGGVPSFGFEFGNVNSIGGLGLADQKQR